MANNYDEMYMKKAIEQALMGEGKTNTNPLVGAVIVKDGKILSEGFHEKYGQAHAEVNAINKAGEQVEGSTIYVTLEPCCHYGKTPPCCDLIINKNIKRVVIAALDPNPLVAGKGVSRLLEAGIEVETGILEEDSQKINEVFNKFITTKKPYVVLKSAISLDGKICDDFNESKWISGESSRAKVQKLRNRYKGIMVGVGTVIKDDPLLTCRIKGGRNPVRIVVDSRLRIPAQSNLLKDQINNQTYIACIEEAPKEKIKILESLGAKVIICRSLNGKVDLIDLTVKLGELSIDGIMLEGGATLNEAALKQDIVDKLILYVAPKIIGGIKNKSFAGGLFESRLSQAHQFEIEEVEKSGEDILITAYKKRGG